METLEPIIAQHPFLKDLEKKHLDLIVGCASNVRFNPDEHLFHEGDEATKFFIIRGGSVALHLHLPPKGLVTIQTMGEGEVLGWSWLFPPYRWHFDAVATELTRAIALDATCLRKKCENDHDLGYELLKRFSNILEQRLQSMRLQLLDIYAES